MWKVRRQGNEQGMWTQKGGAICAGLGTQSNIQIIFLGQQLPCIWKDKHYLGNFNWKKQQEQTHEGIKLLQGKEVSLKIKYEKINICSFLPPLKIASSIWLVSFVILERHVMRVPGSSHPLSGKQTCENGLLVSGYQITCHTLRITSNLSKQQDNQGQFLSKENSKFPEGK